MALIVCEDCGKEYSNLAAACIHCGRPNEIVRGSHSVNQTSSNQVIHEYNADVAINNNEATTPT